MKLREKVPLFFKIINNKKIPLLIFSAGNGDVIKEYLEKRKLLNEKKNNNKIKNKKNDYNNNNHILSNFFIFDKAGKAISFTKPQIHVFNKNESCIKNNNYKKQISERKNVILIGDSLGDTTMADGMNHDCVLKIGFYNHDKKDSVKIKKYSENYDIIITDNGDFNYINNLLIKIIADKK
jgi:5'-nucleotidase